jgi:hypothetical protein
VREVIARVRKIVSARVTRSGLEKRGRRAVMMMARRWQRGIPNISSTARTRSISVTRKVDVIRLDG